MCQPASVAPRKTGNKNGSKWIRPERRLAIYLRDGFACVYCGRDLRDADPREVTLDHLRPRIMGGDNASTNLVTACLSCNSSRGMRPWRTFAPGGAVERIQRQIRRRVNLKLAKSILAGDVQPIEAAR
jgi:5-methylcytosine-specific restriction endonuclease McrA